MTGPEGRGCDDALSSIRSGTEDLAVALAIWEARDDTRADAHARRTASGAVDAGAGGPAHVRIGEPGAAYAGSAADDLLIRLEPGDLRAWDFAGELS